jgi:hypothetical protein
MTVTKRPLLIAFTILLVIQTLSLSGHGQSVRAQTPEPTLQWSRPIPISGALSGSWYPTIAADDVGNAYLVWTVSTGTPPETHFVSRFDGVAWSRPVDVLQSDSPQSSAILDGRNELHLLLVDGGSLLVRHTRGENVGSARSWTDAYKLNRTEATAGDYVIDPRGVIYAVVLETDETCVDCQHIAFTEVGNPDMVVPPFRIISDANALIGSPQILRAPNGTLYAMWIAPGRNGLPAGVDLSISKNDGETWLDIPYHFGVEGSEVSQALLRLDRNGQLVLIFNLNDKDETFYTISADDGETWTAHLPVPGLLAGRPTTGLDRFAAAPDGDGIIHLIAVGRARKDQSVPGLYHLRWDGESWSGFREIFASNNFLESPSIAIGNGNQLFVSFSSRSMSRVEGPPDPSYQVWYTTLQTEAQPATRVPLPTFTPTPTATPTLAPTAEPTRRPPPTPAVALEGDANAVPPQTDQTLPILLGIVPAVGILLIAVVMTTILRRRR